MNCALLACILVLSDTASPISGNNENTETFRFENHSDGEGNYRFSIETLDGIQRQECGQLVNRGQENEYLEVQGEYSYFLESQGRHEVVHYCIDDRGFHLYFDGEKPQIDSGSASKEFSGLPSDAIATLFV